MVSGTLAGAPKVHAKRVTKQLAFRLQVALILLAAFLYGVFVLPRAWNRINTDFPNYYVTARLLREGVNVDRIYEWEWFARQKDRMAIDQPISGFIPHTPFSAILLVPLTYLDPLAAKRLWIVLNAAMLFGIAAMLARLSALRWTWIFAAILLSVPVYRNFEYGQMYVLLLLLITGALLVYLQHRKFTSGILIAIAAGLKIFPILLVVYFVRKRDWRATAGSVVGLAVVGAISWLAFSKAALLTFCTQVLPPALRGEANDPYNLSAASISSLLHHLALFDPQLNLHPVLRAPTLLAVLQAAVQLSILAIALLLVRPGGDAESVRLEWAAMVVAILAVSSMPASYHFVLLLLPLAVYVGHVAKHGRRTYLISWLALYAVVVWPLWPRFSADGWSALLAVPRLWAVLLLFLLCAVELSTPTFRLGRSEAMWSVAIALFAVVQITAAYHHVHRVYDLQRRPLFDAPYIYSATAPSLQDGQVRFSAMTVDGWRLAEVKGNHVLLQMSDVDVLAQTSSRQELYAEKGGDIWVTRDGEEPALLVRNAQQPAVSGEKSLYFVRQSKRGATIWLRDARTSAEKQMTPDSLDVYEMNAEPGNGVIFSAAQEGKPQLYRLQSDGAVIPLGIAGARWPAVSPDGRQLAYSRNLGNRWNLFVRDLQTHSEKQFLAADCNQSSPAWDADSRTLIYASDCGRGLWESTLYREPLP